MKLALIGAVTDQDGASLAEFLFGKVYLVNGLHRPISFFNTDRIDHFYQDPHDQGRGFILHHGDVTDSSSFVRIIQLSKPDEIDNLAAQSQVAALFEELDYTANPDASGAHHALEVIRILGLGKKRRFPQAATSELNELAQEVHEDDATPLNPRTPQPVAKLHTNGIPVTFFEAYGRYASDGILFSHDVEMQWLMWQQVKPEYVVITTGVQYPVRDFVNATANKLGMSID